VGSPIISQKGLLPSCRMIISAGHVVRLRRMYSHSAFCAH
jgi:hypothetical protein